MRKEKSPLLKRDDKAKNYSSILSEENEKFEEFNDISNFRPTTLAWHNISVSIPLQKKKWFCRKLKNFKDDRFILRNVSGKASPGQLLAILGSSGAGKTTLMNVLTSRNLKNVSVYGKIMVNGHPMDKSSMGSSAYVQQEDLFIGALTVKEHLIFQAMLRIDQKISRKNRMSRVEDVIAQLGLWKCANTKIGIPGRIKGISGGEMRRLSFASEILTNPSLLFCDEPTSGLDAFMALSIISVLRQMAADGCTVICTIHQPSSEVYATFDQVLYLANGQVAFMGETVKALDFFANIGLQCPPNFNPSDYFINELAVIPGSEESCKTRINKICEAYSSTKKETGISEPEHKMELMCKQTTYKVSWFLQFYVILWRSFLSIRRDPVLTTMRFIQTIVVALLLGCIYWQQTFDQDGIMNINGVLFLFLTNVTFQNMFAVINVFCTELPVLLREHWNGLYRTEIYFLCKMLAEVPIFVLLPAVFTSVVYWMVGLQTDLYAFILCVGIVTLASNAACSFGYMISCLSSSSSMAFSIGPILIIPFMLFGGFLLNNGSIPVYFLWVKYLSWFYYGYEALCIVQWTDVKHIDCGNSTACITNGEVVLESLNFNKSNLSLDICLLCALIVGYRFIAFVGLHIKMIRRK